MNRAQELSLAWDLMESATQYLSPDTRAWLCAHIGAGELDTAIRTVLSCLATHKAQVPQNILAGLQDWREGYEGSPRENTLRMLITQLRVSAPVAQYQCMNSQPRSRLTIVRPLTRPARRV